MRIECGGEEVDANALVPHYVGGRRYHAKLVYYKVRTKEVRVVLGF